MRLDALLGAGDDLREGHLGSPTEDLPVGRAVGVGHAHDAHRAEIAPVEAIDGDRGVGCARLMRSSGHGNVLLGP